MADPDTRPALCRAGNTIRFESNGQNLANIDQIEIR
jgi:hypothetical protein